MPRVTAHRDGHRGMRAARRDDVERRDARWRSRRAAAAGARHVAAGSCASPTRFAALARHGAAAPPAAARAPVRRSSHSRDHISEAVCARDPMGVLHAADGRAGPRPAPRSSSRAGVLVAPAVFTVFFLLTQWCSEMGTAIASRAVAQVRRIGQTLTYSFSHFRARVRSASKLPGLRAAAHSRSQSCRLAAACAVLLFLQALPAVSSQPPGFDVR